MNIEVPIYIEDNMYLHTYMRYWQAAFGFAHAKNPHQQLRCSSTPNKMIILRYHEVFFRLAAPTAMPAHLGAYSLEKTSWYCNIIILLGVEEHPKFLKFINTDGTYHDSHCIDLIWNFIPKGHIWVDLIRCPIIVDLVSHLWYKMQSSVCKV